MLIRVRHETIYRYGAPTKGATQRLLMTPRNCDSQRIRRWRVEVDHDCRLIETEDAFGNISHRFYVHGSFSSLTTLVEGEVETFDTAGVMRGSVERFPLALYLRDTPLTQASAALSAFTEDLFAQETTTLAKLHTLNGALYDSMTFDTDTTHVATTAAEAFEHRQGVCQDFAHMFIACARTMGVPARYVSGYFCRADGADDQAAGHAWAEAYVEDLGWVGFDPAHGRSPDESHVRVAAALDYLGAAPIRGARIGGGSESMEVRVRVAEAFAQTQN